MLRSLFCLSLLLTAFPARGEDAVSFRHEVMAVLSRAGCNMGACHGNQNGKNGFKLSLRGEDPAFDLLALTRDTQARRVNLLDPATSLILAKATGGVPHEGGKRFGTRSTEYALLRNWIRQGARDDPQGTASLHSLQVTPDVSVLLAPDRSVQLRVQATFSDNKTREVTPLAVYELSSNIARVDEDGFVRGEQSGSLTVLVRYLDQQRAVRLDFVPPRPHFIWKAPEPVNEIDRLVFARLKVLKMRPSEIAPDAIFLRRLFLDTLAILPTAEESRQFLDDKRPDKRERMIEAVLKRPEFNDFWALKWSDVLKNEEKTLDVRGVQVFHDWIRRNMAENRPLNEFARELLLARGSTYSSPPANYYRALRDPQIRAETTAQVFLGVRLQCARCHNHPFDHWKQDDYHNLTAFFARVQYRIIENKRKDRLDKHEFIGEQIVYQDRAGEVQHPRTGLPLSPRFLGGDKPKLGAEDDRLLALADWVARPDNAYFARAQANRIWYHLMGRGVVEPNDDFRLSNPPTNPALLDYLAKELAATKFDLRSLSRTILRSRVYQLSGKPNETNSDDEEQFSRGLVRRLQAEQLLDAISQVLDVPNEFTGHPIGIRAGQLPGSRAPVERGQKLNAADRFLQSFGKPVRSLTCECERSTDTTISHVLHMMSGELVDALLTKPDNRIGKLLRTGKTNDEILDELMLCSISRYPTEKERKGISDHLNKTGNRRKGFEDVVWAVLNSKEFLIRQ